MVIKGDAWTLIVFLRCRPLRYKIILFYNGAWNLNPRMLMSTADVSLHPEMLNYCCPVVPSDKMKITSPHMQADLPPKIFIVFTWMWLYVIQFVFTFPFLWKGFLIVWGCFLRGCNLKPNLVLFLSSTKKYHAPKLKSCNPKIHSVKFEKKFQGVLLFVIVFVWIKKNRFANIVKKIKC